MPLLISSIIIISLSTSNCQESAEVRHPSGGRRCEFRSALDVAEQTRYRIWPAYTGNAYTGSAYTGMVEGLPRMNSEVRHNISCKDQKYTTFIPLHGFRGILQVCDVPKDARRGCLNGRTRNSKSTWTHARWMMYISLKRNYIR